MPVAQQDFDLTLLTEEALADDPYPDRPLLLRVMGYHDVEADRLVASVEIRTSPDQLGLVFAKFRALQLTLAQRATQRARAEETREEAKLRLLQEANAHLRQAEDPAAHIQLLRRVRTRLEDLGPAPRDSPQGGHSP